MATDGMSVSSDGNVKASGEMQTDSASAVESGLGSGVFPDHPRSGFWFSAKGQLMEAWEMKPLESVAEGDTRHQTPSTITQTWDSDIIVSTPMTTGKGQSAGPTDLPNHRSEG